MATEPLITNNGYGGDFVVDDSGALVYITDDTQDDPATQQALVRLIFTQSRNSDQGIYVDPEDVHHPDWGVGARAHVDDPTNQATQNELTSKTLSGLANYPGVSPDTPPTVGYDVSGNQVNMLVTYVNQNGDTVQLPSLPLNPAQQ